MQMEQLSLDDLQRLLGQVAGHGTQHLREVEADLAQTAYLLEEAIEKLLEGFMRIHGAVGEQQRAVDAVLADLEHEVLETLAQHGEDESPVAAGRLLLRIGERLKRQSSALQDGLKSGVSQQDMNSGDIELF